MCKYVKKESFENAVSCLLGIWVLQWANRIHRGDMCSRKMKFQLQWEHGWPEAQLSHFLRDIFCIAVLFCSGRDSNCTVWCACFLRTAGASTAPSSQPAARGLICPFASCLCRAETMNTSAPCRYSSALWSYQPLWGNSSYFLRSLLWSKYLTNTVLDARSAVLAAS